MGGAIAEGNMTPAAEFNVWADPEAAQKVFRAGLDVTMAGLDVTHKAVLGRPGPGAAAREGSTGMFVAELDDFFTVYHRRVRLGRRADPRRGRRSPGDPAGPRRDDGPERRGRARVGALPRPDGRRPLERTDRAPNAHVGVDLDATAFFELLVERIRSLLTPEVTVSVCRT